MIPILYETNETEFTTLGIGPLGDAIKCVVTEELNGEYELEMTYPVSGIHYSELAEDKLIYAVPFEGGRKQIFKIYEIEKPLDGKVTVRAEHIHYLLNKMVVKPFTATSAAEAMSRLKSNVIDACPFTFSTDKTLEATFKMVVPIECGKVLGGVEGSILDVYGPGEYEFDNFDVILHAHRGNDNGITVRYGKNMTELESKVDTTSVYTGIVPYYRDSEDNITYATGYVVWSDHKSDYAYPMAKVVDMSSQFDSERESYESSHPDEIYAPTPEQLLAKANSYLTKNTGWDKNTNIKVSFVNLWQSDEYAGLAVLERVKLGDTVTVIYQKLGVSTTKKVIKTEYNVLLDRYDSIELGKPTTSLTSEVANTSNAIDQAVTDSRSMMDKAIDHATKLITGGLGGHVVINTNAAGNPNEILIMDTASKETAVNVWRWNLNGLGHSHSGYDGPFNDVALTADGKINATMITTGTLNANIIKAGIISGEDDENYWNLETGQFHLAGGTTIGNSTVATTLDVNTVDRKITSEVSRATRVEGTLSSDISDEATRATNAENALSGSIVAVEETLGSRITQTEGAITAEVSRATRVEGTLSSDISDEATRAMLAEKMAFTNYSGNYVPTTSNEPASSWTTDEQKKAHVGEIFYNTSTSRYYQWYVTLNSSGNITASGWKAKSINSSYDLVTSTADSKLQLTENSFTVSINTEKTAREIADNTEKSAREEADATSFANYVYTYAPTSSNVPASSWTTDESKKAHVGEVFYNKSTKKYYQWYVTLDSSGNVSTSGWAEKSITNKYDLVTNTTASKLQLTDTNFTVAIASERTAREAADLAGTYNYIKTYVPTNNNKPASDWTTDELKRDHVGEVLYRPITGSSGEYYIYTENNGVYGWELTSASTPFDLVTRSRASRIDMTDEMISMEVSRATTAERRIFANYSGAYVPTLQNAPAVNWTTEQLALAHNGETFYNTANNKYYRYVVTVAG